MKLLPCSMVVLVLASAASAQLMSLETRLRDRGLTRGYVRPVDIGAPNAWQLALAWPEGNPTSCVLLCARSHVNDSDDLIDVDVESGFTIGLRDSLDQQVDARVSASVPFLGRLDHIDFNAVNAALAEVIKKLPEIAAIRLRTTPKGRLDAIGLAAQATPSTTGWLTSVAKSATTPGSSCPITLYGATFDAPMERAVIAVVNEGRAALRIDLSARALVVTEAAGLAIVLLHGHAALQAKLAAKAEGSFACLDTPAIDRLIAAVPAAVKKDAMDIPNHLASWLAHFDRKRSRLHQDPILWLFVSTTN